jgi:predicted kinase
MTKGLPGSGKSTWAKEQVLASGGNIKRVNKDDLRRMVDAGKWSKNNEKFILKLRDQLIWTALSSGFSVIVDDTNFAPVHESDLRVIAKELTAKFEIKDFTDVPLEVCIERDLQRLESVGEKVIRDMYKRYLEPKPEPPPTHNPDLPTCVIVDIDGTVALMNGRGPYDEHLVHTDLPHGPVVTVVKAMAAARYHIVFMSGRSDACRQRTVEWLKGVFPDLSALLHMRRSGDSRPDYIVKRELYEKYVKPCFNTHCVFDDRNSVVNEWRRLGLTCLQVAPGDF